VVNHPLPALHGECLCTGVKSRLVRVVNIVHPCRIKSFRKTVSAVMDDLATYSEIIENLNVIVKPVDKE